MTFDTLGAAILAAQGTGAGPDEIMAAARRACTALSDARAQVHDAGRGRGRPCR